MPCPYGTEGMFVTKFVSLVGARHAVPLPSWRALRELLFFNGQVSDKSPIAARININISHRFLRDDDVGLIPQGQHRHVATDNLLDARIELFSLVAIESIYRLVDEAIELPIAVAAAISRGARFGGNFRSGEQVLKKDRILIAAHPLPVKNLKVAAPQLIKKRIEFRSLNADWHADVLQLG